MTNISRLMPFPAFSAMDRPPYVIAPLQADQGESIAIQTANGRIVAVIPPEDSTSLDQDEMKRRRDADLERAVKFSIAPQSAAFVKTFLAASKNLPDMPEFAELKALKAHATKIAEYLEKTPDIPKSQSSASTQESDGKEPLSPSWMRP